MFFIIYIYRRYCLRFTYWDSTFTYLLFSLYQFLITFYWVGDYERDLYIIPYYIKIYTFFIVIFVLNFFMHGFVFHRYLYRRGLMSNVGILIFNTVQSYFQKNLVKHLVNEFKDYLNNEWYNYQLNYKKYYKSRFILFMYFISLLLIAIHIYIFIKILGLIFFSPHKWTTFLVIRFERKILLYLIKILKLLFLQNLILSLTFGRLKYSWFFLFFAFETNENYIFPVIQRYDIWDIVGVYGGQHYYEAYESSIMMKKIIKGNGRRKLIKNPEYRKMFKLESLDNSRYRIPKKWNSYKMPELDCIITYNYYFKFWLWLQKYYAITLGINSELEALNIVLTRKHFFNKKAWISYNIYRSCNNSYEQNKLYKITKSRLKKYEFK